MTDANHKELLNAIMESRAKIMISGYESDMYNEYLKGWHKKYFQSCAEHNGSRTEVVWMNYEYYAQISLADLWQQG